MYWTKLHGLDLCYLERQKHRGFVCLFVCQDNTDAELGSSWLLLTPQRCWVMLLPPDACSPSWVLPFSSMEMVCCALCLQMLFYGRVLASGGGWVLLFENCGGGSGQHNCLHQSDPELASHQPYRNTDRGCDDLPFAGGVSLLLLPEQVLAGLHSSYWLISPPTSTFSSLPSS